MPACHWPFLLVEQLRAPHTVHRTWQLERSTAAVVEDLRIRYSARFASLYLLVVG